MTFLGQRARRLRAALDAAGQVGRLRFTRPDGSTLGIPDAAAVCTFLDTGPAAAQLPRLSSEAVAFLASCDPSAVESDVERCLIEQAQRITAQKETRHAKKRQ